MEASLKKKTLKGCLSTFDARYLYVQQSETSHFREGNITVLKI